MPIFTKFDKNEVPEISKKTKTVHRLSKISKFDSQIYKNNIFQNVPYFLIFLKYFGIFKSINKGSPGVKNPEIMEMLGFGPSHNKTKILLDQN